MVNRKSSSLDFHIMAFYKMEEMFGNGELEKIQRAHDKIINLSELSEKEQELYLNKVKFVNDVKEEFGPTFLNIKKRDNDLFTKAQERYGFTTKTAWQTIRIFLQNGFDYSTLMSKKGKTNREIKKYNKKTGRPSSDPLGQGIVLTEELKHHFDEAINYYLSGRSITKKDAYEWMIYKHYTYIKQDGKTMTKDLVPINQRPTLRQFYHYALNSIDTDMEKIAKTSGKEYRNDERLLLSDSTINASGPMSICEIDECEADCFIVSSFDRNIVVGRPIIYAMVDIYTRMIVAVSVAYDNNSIIGVTSCLLNLLDDKKELCSKYDIEINNDIWVDHYLPNILRCDNGSEYISYEFERICKELGINKEIVSPGTGSLKGLVEKSFDLLHKGQNYILENNGLIEKRHDSNHKETAKLTLEEFKQLVYSAVAVHNSKYFETYPLTKDMRSNKVKPIPYQLWKYGINKSGTPLRIVNDQYFKYTLLKEVSASISRDGITFKDLKYINYQDETLLNMMVKAGSRKIKMKFRIDPRNITNIYFKNEGIIHSAYLNTNKTGMIDYYDMSLAELEKLKADKSTLNKGGEDYNLKLSIALKEKQRRILSSVQNNEASSKDLQVNREHEKISNQKENLIMGKNDTDVLPQFQNNTIDCKNDNTEYDSLAKYIEIMQEMENDG